MEDKFKGSEEKEHLYLEEEENVQEQSTLVSLPTLLHSLLTHLL
jgi:hypothetical protein